MMAKLLPSSGNTQEAHFQMCLMLMILFFFVDLGTSALVAFHMTTAQIGGGTAHDAYVAFFGISLGIFRGMQPDGISIPTTQPGMTTTSELTTTSVSTNPLPSSPVQTVTSTSASAPKV